MVLQVENIK